MASCRDVIKTALRKINAYGGGNEPTADQAQDAMDSLSAMFLELAGQGVFGRLYDVIVTTDTYTACPGQRVVCNSADDATITVTLPTTIQAPNYPNACCYETTGEWYYPTTDYDFCCVGWYWTNTTPQDGACIAITDLQGDTKITFVYSADNARWMQLEGLTLDSPFPFGDRYREAFANSLAIRLLPEYSSSAPNPILVQQALSGMMAFCNRRDRWHPPARADYF